MPTLFHEPEAPENAPDAGGQPTTDPRAEAPEAVVERPCSNCGAPLAEGQEWCLECGTPVTAAARVRGGLPGWRTAAAVIAVTLVMASGAVAAAYAAMRSDDGTTTQTAPDTAVAQVATIPQPDPIDIPPEAGGAATVTTPAAGSAATPPPVTPPAASSPVATPAPTPAPVATPAPTPTPTPAAPTTTSPATTPTTGQGSSAGSDAPVKRAAFVAVPLDPDTTVASAYNPPVPASAATTPPAGTTTDPATTTPATTDPATGAPTSPATTAGTPAHAATDFTGEPKLAFDGDPTTAWSVNLPSPALLANPQAGLLIDLGDAATTLRRLTLTPTTPGTTIVVYGTTAATAPATLKDKGWKKLATQLDVTGKTSITLGDDVTGTAKLRQVLIWFSEGPDDGTSASVGISELKLYK